MKKTPEKNYQNWETIGQLWDGVARSLLSEIVHRPLILEEIKSVLLSKAMPIRTLARLKLMINKVKN